MTTTIKQFFVVMQKQFACCVANGINGESANASIFDIKPFSDILTTESLKPQSIKQISLGNNKHRVDVNNY